MRDDANYNARKSIQWGDMSGEVVNHVIIINNIVKIRKNDNPNFLNNKNDLKRGNKREKRFYNKKNNNKNKKIQIAKLNKYYKKRKKFKS